MKQRVASLLCLAGLTACTGDSPTAPTSGDPLEFPQVAGTYSTVLTTFIRYLDGPLRGQPESSVCPGRLVVSDQRGSLFLADLELFVQSDCPPVG